ncbi:MAG: YbhB/YbcL family Raf kinase inhibitor-like protein [Pirellulales bacterium]
MKLTVSSSAFEAGNPIPKKYTGEGRDISPPLAWSDAPEGTKEFALICDDPDAPSRAKPGPEPWVHWVLYKIPAATRALPEGVPTSPKLDKPIVALQGLNSWPKSGYGGPMPPPRSGAHRYYFKVYALDAPLSPDPRMTKMLLLDAMKGHILAYGELMGTYER